MRTERYVHFVYLGGDWVWQHWRAVETAQVHDAPITIWQAAEIRADAALTRFSGHVHFRALELPDWLRDHPIQLANVKDAFMWRILFEHGGLYLDMDTISLAPVWDLLTRDVLVSQEWPSLSDGEHPYNSAVVAARKGAPVLTVLYDEATALLEAGETGWGECGPHLLTRVVGMYPGAFDVAPFGVLSGWRDDTISSYYDGERPGPDARVVHLYSSSRMDRFLADRWMP